MEQKMEFEIKHCERCFKLAHVSKYCTHEKHELCLVCCEKERQSNIGLAQVGSLWRLPGF